MFKYVTCHWISMNNNIWTKLTLLQGNIRKRSIDGMKITYRFEDGGTQDSTTIVSNVTYIKKNQLIEFWYYQYNKVVLLLIKKTLLVLSKIQMLLCMCVHISIMLYFI